MHSRSLADIPTLLLALVLFSGQSLLFYSGLPFLLMTLGGILLMNLSFTIWHECSHGNFSRLRLCNDLLGSISSLATLGPGYFARKREHLAHHRWQGDLRLDPVYPRIQSSALHFPFRLLRLALTERVQDNIPIEFLPLTSWQKNIDRTITALALAFSALLLYFGYWREWLALWLIPRFVIFFLHAFYICFLPHSVKGGGFVIAKELTDSRWAFLLTLGQNLHGFHHNNPQTPWYRYQRRPSA